MNVSVFAAVSTPLVYGRISEPMLKDAAVRSRWGEDLLTFHLSRRFFEAVKPPVESRVCITASSRSQAAAQDGPLDVEEGETPPMYNV